MVEQDKVSFIPKKTLTKPTYKRSGMGLLVLVSVLLFLLSAAALGGAYLYKKSLENRIASLSDSLKRAEDILDPVFIREVTELERKIEESKRLLRSHHIATPVLSFLESSTLANVRFSSFTFSFPDENEIDPSKRPTLTLSGSAKSYSLLALQADEFGKNKSIGNLVIANLSLGQGGLVDFSASMEFDPIYLGYKEK